LNEHGGHHLIKCPSNASIRRYPRKHVCFVSHSPKKIARFHKLADLFNTKGNKILQNVKTYWILMFFPSKIIYSEYWPLIVKIHIKSPKNDTTNKNLNALYDMELILGLSCLLSLFECAHKLIKIVQGRDVFVCDLMEDIKLAQLELFKFYCHSFTKFEDVTFDDLNAIGNLTNAAMLMQ
jgi:hypothetical protein